MHKKTAAVIGASGLIGSRVMQYLIANPNYETVRTLVRWPATAQHVRQEVKLVQFDDPESLLLALHQSDVVFCCIGTTQKKVGGNREQYIKIDHDIPVRACKMAMETGCKSFIWVSALGANPQSQNFYLKLKGRTEADLIQTGIERLHIMQPGLLLGKRQESRPIETLSQAIMKPLSKLLVGSWSQYRAIEADAVARAMVAAANSAEPGVFRYRYAQMQSLAAAISPLPK